MSRDTPLSAREALAQFVEAYEADFGSDGYDRRDMIDYVVVNALDADLEVHAQANGIGWSSLVAWYKARIAYIERQWSEFNEAGVEPGAPSTEQRARRGKVRGDV